MVIDNSTWDDGYPSGGNHWDDYAGVDFYSGPFQNETGSDGIGDPPYSVGDRYPLMKPWGSPQLPIAIFTHSPEQPDVGALVTFNASRSYDRDGTIVSYKWDFGNDNVTTLTNPIITHVYMAPGTYTVNLTVTDNDGLWHSTTKSLTVIEDSNPPTTVDDYDGLWHTTDFTITLTATDDMSGVAETYYKINDGPTKTVSTHGQPLITIEGANNKLEYWSIDKAGNEELPHKILTRIKLDKTAPTGSVIVNNGDTYTTSTSVTLTLTATDVTSGVYQVRFSNDGVWDTEPWEDFSPTKIWTLTSGDGTKIVHYQIKDNAGLVSITYSDTIILDTPKPIANAGNDQTVKEDTPVTFDGSASQDDYGIASYTWTFTDVTPKTLTGVNPTYTFATPGTYTVTLNVTDAVGNWDTDEVVITVLDVTAPVANAGPDQTVAEETLVTFNGSQSSDNVHIINYTWTFVDITLQTLNGINPAYNFTTPGNYIVTLTVEDTAGNNATDTITITVLLDTDGDGTPDITDPDDDNDGVNDDGDAFSLDPTEWVDTDRDGIGNNADTDDDNDGVLDINDAFPLDPTESVDTDGDGVGNNADTDDDNDGMPDSWEIENGLDPLDPTDASLDPDGDGLTNLEEYQEDTDPNLSDAEALPTGAFPLWVLGAVAAAIGTAIVVTFLWRRRK
ncbi:MAG: PKD domain-containing protein [Candidatus Bathyarchaeota archaeon]